MSAISALMFFDGLGVTLMCLVGFGFFVTSYSESYVSTHRGNGLIFDALMLKRGNRKFSHVQRKYPVDTMQFGRTY